MSELKPCHYAEGEPCYWSVGRVCAHCSSWEKCYFGKDYTPRAPEPTTEEKLTARVKELEGQVERAIHLYADALRMDALEVKRNCPCETCLNGPNCTERDDEPCPEFEEWYNGFEEKARQEITSPESPENSPGNLEGSDESQR